MPHQLQLPLPGELVLHRYARPGAYAPFKPRPLKLIQWNIERGYELDLVVKELQALDADIVCLQEIDIGCERSNCQDTGMVIAEALQMNYVFVCEFEELHSPRRDERSQGGGVHGNGILSRFEISNPRAVEHRFHPVEWTMDHPTEPRNGRRLTLAATVETPAGPLLCYSAHLEVFCGILGRISQFADIMRDSKEQIAQGLTRQAVLGDLNTMGHGIARLSPKFCRDKMRFWSIGQTEAQFWHDNVITQVDPRFCDGGPGLEDSNAETVNKKLLGWGVDEQVCRDCLNPGFADPFDPVATVTLANHMLFGRYLMQGKLDWLLLRGCTVVSKNIGNHNFSASDHKWLAADITF